MSWRLEISFFERNGMNIFFTYGHAVVKQHILLLWKNCQYNIYHITVHKNNTQHLNAWVMLWRSPTTDHVIMIMHIRENCFLAKANQKLLKWDRIGIGFSPVSSTWLNFKVYKPVINETNHKLFLGIKRL